MLFAAVDARRRSAATPDPLSLALSVKSTLLCLNQPFEPSGEAGAVASDVAGGVVSLATVTGAECALAADQERYTATTV